MRCSNAREPAVRSHQCKQIFVGTLAHIALGTLYGQARGHGPTEMDRHLRTAIIAPMTTVTRPYPTRVAVRFQGKRGQVALDQLRSVDRQRLVRILGEIPAKTAQDVSATLVEMFART